MGLCNYTCTVPMKCIHPSWTFTSFILIGDSWNSIVINYLLTTLPPSACSFFRLNLHSENTQLTRLLSNNVKWLILRWKKGQELFFLFYTWNRGAKEEACGINEWKAKTTGQEQINNAFPLQDYADQSPLLGGWRVSAHWCNFKNSINLEL